MNNDQSKTNIDREHDAEDQLVDWGLNANSGAEAAPDLSDKILAAIAADSSAETTSSVSTTDPQHTNRNYWPIGIAATLLIGLVGGYFLVQNKPQNNSRFVETAAVSLDPAQEAEIEKAWREQYDKQVMTMRTPAIVIQEEEELALVVDGALEGEEKESKLSKSQVASDQSGLVRFGNVSNSSSGPTALTSDFGLEGGTGPVAINGGMGGGGMVVTSQDGATFTFEGRRENHLADSTAKFAPPGSDGYEANRFQKWPKEALSKSNAAPFSFFIPNTAESRDVTFGQLPDVLDVVRFEGQDVNLYFEPVTSTQTQAYTVNVPQQRTRTENYTVTVPEKRTRTVQVPGNGSRTETYTVNVPVTRSRTVNYTVNVPETRSRTIQIVNHVPKVLDKNGNEIALDEAQRKALGFVIQQQGLGQGPEVGGDKYTRIHENPFVVAKGTDAVSTFSIDVDTASYSNVRQYLNNGQLPPPDAVRLEELVNYFDYDYAGPDGEEHPFATHTEVAGCPWNSQHRLVRVAIKGREIAREKRPLSNVVFLVDVSGSMNEPNKLPLVVEGLSYMAQELGENDQVSIVVYAGSEGLALPSTRGDQHDKILEALENLAAGGSTAGGAGIKLAYKVAEENFIKGGTNRVILCTDGDFNVGVTSTADLERLAEAKAKETGVFLTVLGYGRGNLNDAMMETISNRGNGNYHYIDNLREARRVLVQQLSGTLVTIAKDVKIQVEFNPGNVAAYRLLGYENRMLERKDFNDDTKDAGEVGAGHTVTALYEVVPVGVEVEVAVEEDELKYQQTEPKPDVEEEPVDATKFTDELLTLRLRYKQPTESSSTKIEVAVKDEDLEFDSASEDFRFATSVAGFGMLLRGSQHKGDVTYSQVKDIAAKSLGDDDRGYRAEFLNLIDIAGDLSGEEEAVGAQRGGRRRAGGGY